MTVLSKIWSSLDVWSLGMIAVFTVFCIVLHRLDRADDNEFRFSDFFTWGNVPGKANVTQLGYFLAMMVHSLIVLHQEMKNKGGITDTAMTLYALVWSGAYIVTKAIENRTAIPLPQGDANGRADSNQPNP